MLYFLAGLLITLSSGGPPTTPRPGQDGAHPAVLSATELREHIGIAQQRIESVYLVYRSDSYQGAEERAAGTYVLRIIAAKSPGSILHLTAHGTRDQDWRLDFRAQRAIIASNRAVNVYDVNRAFVEEELSSAAPLPGSLPGEPFFHATGVFPLKGRPAPKRIDDGSPSVLRDVAASREFNVVRPRLEELDGRWCHVLERPGADALWIDVEHGCALLAREAIDPKSGALMWRFECGGHLEKGPGIWLPAWIRYLQFDPNARTADLRRRMVADSRIEILQAEVNSVGDESFSFSPPDGALRLDLRGRNHVQVHPHGVDHLDKLVDWTKQVRDASSKTDGKRSDPGELSIRDFCWGILGFLVGGLVVSLIRQASAKRLRPPLSGAG